ncbi:MBL fold metallo-hydrolase [Scopulibacillus cellulosilyticus]|uniref:MBL fold metallo-hydrolase n=1 Tax=Scopulibacillus cellulosilyticus TaxID=2665665 RepID=A0ABW2Q0N1_9BACL
MKYAKKKLSVLVLFLLLVLMICASCSASAQTSAKTKKQDKKPPVIKVTLLGTGSPIINKRSGPAALVQAGGEKLLFDSGRGVSVQLHKMGIQPGEIDKVFLTHLHSDHLVGFPNLWLTGSLPTGGFRKDPMQVWGPVGTAQMTSYLEKAFSADIKSRGDSGNGNNKGVEIDAHEIKPGVVYDHNGIKVTAFLVDHVSIKPAYGYRIDYKGHSVTISGDTTYNKNFIKHAKGSDVVISEVAAARPEDLKKNKALENILRIHTTPGQAGKEFSQIKPKLAVFTHIVLLGGLTDKDAHLVSRTKKNYNGKVVVGKDLMTIEIGDKVSVVQPKVHE